ncbi:MAG: tetratricopeptide repeat protein [Chitinivibrionales bacterium]|nr:tetratricopeptide repeat protein [Chitinivibrionales bacterium]
MPPVVNGIIIGLTALFLSIPFINTNVFHTVNIDEMIVAGREGLAKVQEHVNRGDYPSARDSARSLIEHFRTDSLTFFLADITAWDTLFHLMKSDRNDLAGSLIISQFRPDYLDSVRAFASVEELNFSFKIKCIDALNALKDNAYFYVNNSTDMDLGDNRAVLRMLAVLRESAILTEEGGKMQVGQSLNERERRLLTRFHVLILENVLYSNIITKDMKRNRDWASEYTVQTAFFYMGTTYRIQFQLEKAINIYDSLIALYPKTIYAEVLFLQIGQMLYEDGITKLKNDDITSGRESLHKAVDYLKRIEKNREIARQFPKYKLTNLNPGQYTNIDQASIAKKTKKRRSKLYTLEEAKEDLEGEPRDEGGGHNLEDAIKQIGECYIALGKTDSARMQFTLLLNFFSESDNRDDAQQLIAESYVKDGDLILDTLSDTTRAEIKKKAFEQYRNAVKEYLTFINVYPQSDLISDVYIALGDAYIKTGEQEKAVESFASALDLAKDTESKAQIQMQIGDYFLERKRYNKAIEAYQIILTNFLSTQVAPRAQYLMGNCREHLGDTVQAIKEYKTMVKLYKRSDLFSNAAYRIGDYYFKREQYDQAQEYYNFIESYDPEGEFTSKAMFRRGMIWKMIALDEEEESARENAYDKAIEIFLKISELFRGTKYDLDADKACFQAADCYMRIGKKEAAQNIVNQIQNRVQRLESFKIIDPDDDPHAKLKYWRQNYADAIEDEEKATALEGVAEVLFSNLQNYDSALVVYEQILELTEDVYKQIQAKVGISRIMVVKQKYARARDILLELLDNKKVFKELKQSLEIQLYDVYFKMNALDLAMDGFERFIVQYPDHARTPYAVYQVGNIYAKKKQFQKAQETMQIILEKHPQSDMLDKAVLGIGEQMISLGKAEEAVQYLEEFLASNSPDSIPTAPNIYLRLGETYKQELKKPQKAIQCYQTIVDEYGHSPYYPYAAYQLGMTLKEAGDEKKAVAAFDKVEREEGMVYRAAQAEIGKILAKTDPEAAIVNYEKIVAQSDAQEDSALAMLGIGDVYVSVRKWDKAAEMFDKVYSFYSGKDSSLLAGSLVKLVDAYINSKKYDKAIEASQEMQKRFPENTYTINTIYFEGSAWFAKKNYGKALEKFDQVIEKNQSEQLTEIAYYQKGDCYYFRASGLNGNREAQNKIFERAIRHYDTYLKKYPSGKYRANALFMQGNCYWTLQKPKESRYCFQTIVTKYPNFPDMCSTKYYLGASLKELRKDNQALVYFKQVINSGKCSKKLREQADKQREALIARR